MVGDQMVQVTSAGVRLLAAQTGALHHEWLPPSGLQINIASASTSQASSQPTHPALPCPTLSSNPTLLHLGVARFIYVSSCCLTYSSVALGQVSRLNDL